MATGDLTTFKPKKFEETIRDFYRSDIWNEHTRLAEIYKGHKPLIEWGRSFIQESVLSETKKKMTIELEGTINQGLYFCCP